MGQIKLYANLQLSWLPRSGLNIAPRASLCTVEAELVNVTRWGKELFIGTKSFEQVRF